MPLFPHSKIVKARSLNLDDRRQFREALQLLRPGLSHKDEQASIFKAFLEGLPSPYHLRKIKRRLKSLTEHAGKRLESMDWWDISSKGERIVVLRIHRDGASYLVGLIWKRSKRGTATLNGSHPATRGWGRDSTAPFGWRYDIEADTYQRVKVAFRYWLHRKLPPFPV